MSANEPIIDIHQHVGPWPFPNCTGGMEQNLRLNALRGIDRAIVSSALAVVQDIVRGNAELAEALVGHPELLGYVTVNPAWPDESRRQLGRYGSSPLFVGAKLHPHYCGCSIGDPRTARLLEELNEWGRPVLIHTWGAAEVAHLRALALGLPELPIIVAHAGGDAWRAAIAAAEECPNLLLDFTCSTPYAGAIRRALDSLGPRRIVFGSDSTLFDPLYMLAHLGSLPMEAADRRLVMGGNAARIFGLDGA